MRRDADGSVAATQVYDDGTTVTLTVAPDGDIHLSVNKNVIVDEKTHTISVAKN
jgi:hypothetical protein